MPVRNRSLKPSGTLRGLEWETQPAQSAIIGLPVSYRTYRRDILHALMLPWLSLCRDPLRHENIRPLFGCPMAFPLILGCDRPLVGVDAENSEVVQETLREQYILPDQYRS